MPEDKHQMTRFLCLRKTAFSETSLIVAGITPTQGRVDFMLRGERKLGKNKFPSIDVFRLLDVQFTVGRGDLHSFRSADGLASFDGLAVDYGSYRTAAWLARFALENVPHGVEHAGFFAAMLQALGWLASATAQTRPTMRLAAMVVCATCFLQEAGCLDGYDDPRTQAQCDVLINAGTGRGQLPVLPMQTWQELQTWSQRLLRQTECVVPEL